MEHRLTIERAKDGGFIVVTQRPELDEWRTLLFAGSLTECLDYILRHFDKSEG